MQEFLSKQLLANDNIGQETNSQQSDYGTQQQKYDMYNQNHLDSTQFMQPSNNLPAYPSYPTQNMFSSDAIKVDLAPMHDPSNQGTMPETPDHSKRDYISGEFLGSNQKGWKNPNQNQNQDYQMMRDEQNEDDSQEYSFENDP